MPNTPPSPKATYELVVVKILHDGKAPGNFAGIPLGVWDAGETKIRRQVSWRPISDKSIGPRPYLAKNMQGERYVTLHSSSQSFTLLLLQLTASH